MNKTAVKTMRTYLETILVDFEKQFNVKANVGRITYGNNNCRMSLTVSDINEDGTVSTKEAEAFKTQAKIYGLEPEILNTEFTFQGDVYIIKGLNTRASKFPIQCTRKSDGKEYKMPIDLIKKAFNIAPSTFPREFFV